MSQVAFCHNTFFLDGFGHYCNKPSIRPVGNVPKDPDKIDSDIDENFTAKEETTVKNIAVYYYVKIN